MDNEEAIETFQAVTGADHATAEHVLEAHGWDLNRGLDFFMESTSAPTLQPVHRPNAQQEDFAEPTPAGRRRSEIVNLASPEDSSDETPPEAAEPPATAARPFQMSGARDDDLQAALAASLRTGDQSTAHQDEEEAGLREQAEAYDVDEDFPEIPAVSTRAQRSARAASLFGLPPEIAEDSLRVRRNRPRRAAAADPDMEHLAAMGLAAEMPAAFPGSLLHPGLAQSVSPRSNIPTAVNGNGHMDLPAGINMEEARMLEAAMLGVPYEGRIPDFQNQEAAEPPSPSVLRQRELREEQDQAYEESLLADRRKADAAEAARKVQQEEELEIARAEEDAARVQRDYEQEIGDKLSSLPPEPPPSDPDGVSFMIRLPNGARFSRRLSRTCKCEDLFNFVDVNAAPDFKPGSYRLVTQYPRRVFTANKEGSLAEAGLTQKQEALFLEPL